MTASRRTAGRLAAAALAVPALGQAQNAPVGLSPQQPASRRVWEHLHRAAGRLGMA